MAASSLAFAASPPLNATYEDLLASLRATIGIARALDASLIVPQWLSQCGNSVVDVQALASVASLISPADAMKLAVDRGVRVATRNASDHADSVRCLTECLGEMVNEAPDIVNHTLAMPCQPMRSRKEVCAAFAGACGDGRVLLFPRLDGGILSASATVMGVPLRCDLARALATPSLALRHQACLLCDATLRDSPTNREVGRAIGLLSSDGMDHLASAHAAGTRHIPAVDMVIVLDVSSASAVPDDSAPLPPLAERASAAARALINAQAQHVLTRGDDSEPQVGCAAGTPSGVFEALRAAEAAPSAAPPVCREQQWSALIIDATLVSGASVGSDSAVGEGSEIHAGQTSFSEVAASLCDLLALGGVRARASRRRARPAAPR